MELHSLRILLGRICLLFFACALSAEKTPQNQQPTLPTRLEVDLIFPRNDTYAPIYAFPVVFAIRGAAPLINPRTTESLVKVNWYLSAEKAMVSLGNLDFEQQSVVDAGLEPYYMIQAANTLVNSTEASWTLEWTVQLASNSTAWTNNDVEAEPAQVVSAATEIQFYMSNTTELGPNTFFAHYGEAVVGVYAGAGLDKRGVALGVLEDFVRHVEANGISKRLVFQSCEANRSSEVALGIVADTSGGLTALASVLRSVAAWSEGQCLTGGFDGSATRQGRPLWVAPEAYKLFNASQPFSNTTSHNLTTLQHRPFNRLTRIAVAECRTVQVSSGEYCDALARKCNISANDFMKYNPASGFCSTLVPGQWVCCSAGTLPDRSPKPNPDGSCATYTIKQGDGCASIAAAKSITVAQLEEYNKNTWGWPTCKNYIYIDQVICVSSGSPPMPAPIPNAVCGPQKPGSQKPGGSNPDLSKLNPCPLNACCNIWGQCGTTAEFCVDSREKDGAPGTAAKGQNGCISNCGMNIISSDPPPQYISVGYFEAWNHKRPCLWMDVTEVKSTKFSHIHFAFARLTPEFSVDVSYVQSQFDRFINLGGFKKVVAFGGWADSTDPDKFMILRNAVQPRNRLKVAQNIVNFVKVNNLDGVDIDWEYPGAQDIPGVPAATPTEGNDYLAFLQVLRALLPVGRTLSIAAPASHWYLKAFPIAEMSKVVDYIIYMTYDLHGQWDYGNQWSSPGCPNGDCLRSHINLTETINSLSMITKAGVPSKKVIVGVASYGRAFKMVDSNCRGPECKFAGAKSQAKPGICTGEPGYLSQAEIDRIIGTDKSAVVYADADSQSAILVYGGTEWVSYMSDVIKQTRMNVYKRLNFGGTTDWAVDLAEFQPSEFVDPGIFHEIDNTGGCKWRFFDGFDCLHEPHKSPDKFTRAQRWSSFNTDCAWRDFINEYKISRPKDFSQALSLYFDAPDMMNCSKIDVLKSACSIVDMWDCKTFQTEDSGPAGVRIIESVQSINAAFASYYDDLHKAKADLTALLGAFEKTFYQSGDIAAIIANTVGLALAIILPGVFNHIFKGLGANGKDMTLTGYPFLIGLLSAVGTSSPGAETGAQLYLIVINWTQALQKFLFSLFDGSDQSIDNLWRLIRNGQLIAGSDAPRTLDSPSRVAATAKGLLVALIPAAWKQQGYNPVAVSTGKKCGTAGPYDGKYMTGITGNEGWACVDDEIWYLLGVTGAYTRDEFCTCPAPCVALCDQYFNGLPGSNALVPDNPLWSGITREMLIRGAIATRKYKGKPEVDINKPEFYDGLIGGGTGPVDITAPGVINIPTCDIEDAYKGWQKGDTKNPNYPCTY
ncbi:uncharacterized protein E0L32_002376 [Thyridium curvatum]|uniref:chitinase n=1 Tax=Thyridium curvatum TaxID=1093900 RepID=A0A507ARR6_9PEZI|nr:uncharacterized protein E0L32_002376 [Thyridium curvatum]TPX06880.1 hypothetical protein E0L32_002376 [Thyridium curvatum]